MNDDGRRTTNERQVSSSVLRLLSSVVCLLSSVLCYRVSRAGSETQLDAVAVAIVIGPGLFVFDAAPPIERVIGVAAADTPGVGFPGAAHQQSLARDDRGA